jgi:hypothetical protein
MNFHVAVHAEENTFIEFGFCLVPRSGKAAIRDAECFGVWVDMVKGKGTFAFAIPTNLAGSTFVFECHVADFLSSFNDCEFHVLSTISVGAGFFAWHVVYLLVVYHTMSFLINVFPHHR